jgi:hypothetical protein
MFKVHRHVSYVRVLLVTQVQFDVSAEWEMKP